MKKVKIKAALEGDAFMEAFDKLSENEKKNLAYQYMIDYDVATPEEINLVTNINGDSYKSYCDILDVRTGYKDFDQVDSIAYLM